MGSAAANCLTALAQGFAAQGCYLQAIKCYDAICQSSEEELPQVQAQARLASAMLIVEHTDNMQEAWQLLQRAQIQLQQLPAFHSLKCQVFSALGRVLGYLGQHKLARQTYQRALDLCDSTQRSDEREVLQRWRPHFQMRLAHLSSSLHEPQPALEALDQAQAAAQQCGAPDLQAMVQLAKLQLHLAEGSQSAATEALESVGTALKALEQQHPAVQPLLGHQLRLHAEILRTLFVLAYGDTGSAAWVDTTIKTLEGLLAKTQHQPWCYEWVSPDAVTAIVCLLSAKILQPPCKLRQGLMYATRGLEVVEGAMRRANIANDERRMATFSVWEHVIYLQLRVLLTEAAASMHLTQCELAKAQARIGELVDLMACFPQLLGSLEDVVHTLIGHYAMAVGDYAAAQRHFTAAMDLAHGEQAKQMAAIHVAAAWLSGPDEAEGRRQAIDVLSLHGLFANSAQQLTIAERAGGLLVSGLALEGQDAERGKLRLTKALKYAHNSLGNHQMVAQVLNLMAPMHVATADWSGAENMMASGFTLSRVAGDLPSQIIALKVVREICSHKGEVDKQAGNEEYMHKKQEDWKQRVRAATDNAAQHAALLSWQA